MSTVTTMSTKQAETYAVGEYKPLGPLQNFTGDEIVILRHGETIEETFPDWVKRSKIEEDSYTPFDVNCPIELPRRSQMRQSYELDPPLTEMAKITVKMTARELCNRKFYPSVILCTPDFASLETAHLIQKFMGEKCGRIQIEPELSTLHKCAHVFLGKDQLFDMGYNVDCLNLPLEAVSGKIGVTDLMARVKRAFYELTGKIDNALMILDPFSMRIVSSLFYPMKIGVSSCLEIERAISCSNFPPLSNLVAFKLGKLGVKMYDLSNVSLRPVTFTGFSNNIDPE